MPHPPQPQPVLDPASGPDKKEGKCLALRAALNLITVGIIFVPVLYLFLDGTPTVRGFFCNDKALMHPYHKSTVKSIHLYFVGVALPLVVIIFVETFAKRPQSCNDRKRIALDSYFVLLGYLFGCAVTQCLTDIIKYSVGRLRPHFFAVCNPDFGALDCGTEFEQVYVDGDVCRGNPELFQGDLGEATHRLKEGRLSFVSGHASFAFQLAVFLVLYLQARRRVYATRKTWLLIVPLVQFFFLCCAVLVGVTRVLDFKHHTSDVIAGGVLGIVVQILNLIFVMKIFKHKPGQPTTSICFTDVEETSRLKTLDQVEETP